MTNISQPSETATPAKLNKPQNIDELFAGLKADEAAMRAKHKAMKYADKIAAEVAAIVATHQPLPEIVWEPATGAGPVVDRTIEIICADPAIYTRGGRLVRLVAGSEPGSLVASEMSRDALEAFISSHALFLVARTIRPKDGSPSHTENVPLDTPPPWVAKAVYCAAEYPGARPLRAIVPHPFLRPDGSVCSTAGYDRATESFCTYEGPFGARWAEVEAVVGQPDAPYNALNLARWAVGELRKALSGYRWASETALVGWVAALATALARPSLPIAPGFVLAAPIKGASKSTLAFALERLCRGAAESPRGMQGRTEFGKAIFAALATAPTIVTVDNVTLPIAGDDISRLFTAPSFAQRVLGTHDEKSLPNAATWLFTATNPNVAQDMADRLILVQLTGVAGPDFGTPYILERCLDPQWRAGILCLALAILRAYCVAGRPDTLGFSDHMRRHSRCVDWDRLVRSAIHWATGIDIVETQAELAANSAEDDESKDLFCELFKTFGCETFGASDLVSLTRASTFAKYTEGSINQRAAGLLLSRHRDTEQSGWRLTKKHTERGNNYQLIATTPETQAAADARAAAAVVAEAQGMPRWPMSTETRPNQPS